MNESDVGAPHFGAPMSLCEDEGSDEYDDGDLCGSLNSRASADAAEQEHGSDDEPERQEGEDAGDAGDKDDDDDGDDEQPAECDDDYETHASRAVEILSSLDLPSDLREGLTRLLRKSRGVNALLDVLRNGVRTAAVG